MPALKCSRTLVPCWCRAATAAVCLEWAAVHADSRIWEAVSVDCERAHGLRQRGKRTAECLPRWLSARALGLRQLEFCDHCSCLRAGNGEEVRDNVSAPAMPLVTAEARALHRLAGLQREQAEVFCPSSCLATSAALCR